MSFCQKTVLLTLLESVAGFSSSLSGFAGDTETGVNKALGFKQKRCLSRVARNQKFKADQQEVKERQQYMNPGADETSM